MIEFLFITTMWIWGVKCLFSEGFILYFDGKLQEHDFFKPFINCPPCMASVHGTVAFFLFLYSHYGLWMWPVFCIVLCGLNYLLVKLTNIERIIVE